jgi:anaerobic C4-dicarboxylate transporter
MLQRIQSLLLLLAAVALGVFLSTNTWTGGLEGEKIIVNPYQILQMKGGLAAYQKSIFYVAVLAGLAIALSVFAVFQYKNRVRQMLFVALNSLLIGVAVAVSVYHVKYDAMKLDNAGEGNFETGLYAGFAALALNWLANRFIKRDEKMVKDADRMR